VVLARTTINATGSAPVSVTGASNSVIELYAYSRPSTQYRPVAPGRPTRTGA
jgi:hypothetical protein